MTATRASETVIKSHESQSSRENLRELVERASAVIAHYWPMTGFVHHNPIRSLEALPFHQAVRVGERLIKGRGYLSNQQYRKLLKSRRIERKQLDAALEAVARDEAIDLGGRKVSHFEVLRAHLLIGITAPADETVQALVERAAIDSEALALVQDVSHKAAGAAVNRKAVSAEIRELAGRLAPVIEPPDAAGKIGRELTLLTWCDRALHKEFEWLVDKELIKWCEAFLDEGHAPLPMPYREKGFYEAWKALASLEWSPCGISNSARKIESLPESPEEAVIAQLDALAIPPELRQDYLSLELTALSGWASFINWRAEHDNYEWQAEYPIDLVQYLAVRLFYEREIVHRICRDELGIEGTLSAIVSYVRRNEEREKRNPDLGETRRLAAAWRLTMLGKALQISPADFAGADAADLHRLLDWLDEFPESEHGPVWLAAHEACHHEALIEKLRESLLKQETEEARAGRPLAQCMFCIDVRSEPFRRNLEAAGNYETIGFAGFFGIPMRSRALDQHHFTDQLPAIVEPKYTVVEVEREDQAEQMARHSAGYGLIRTIQEMLHDMKSHVLTPYVMVESLGWLFGVQLFGRTLFPVLYRKWLSALKSRVAPAVGTIMTCDRDSEGLGLTIDEQCKTIETVLKTMGLTRNFGRLVVVCGHTSMSDNNPYEAALNCGACGGNSGKPNARLLAAMANKPQVREHLAKNGIAVPDDTHFIGAVHNTTTDAVDLFDLEDLPESHRQDVEQLRAGLKEAAVRTNRERCARLPLAGGHLPAARAVREIARRAGDWSETRPEWGLAGNAAFIIGKRSLTRDIDLEGRVFLNSHDYEEDPTGALLEGVMMGPMVVGQWINAEHYFSATDTEIYGSGSKVYHNVVGRIGIMSGPQSDLRTGLAWQSMMNGELPYHEPLRLLVAIEAPRDRILAIVERQPILKQLCDNEWIHLIAVDRESDEKLYRYRPMLGFTGIADGCQPMLAEVEEQKV